METKWLEKFPAKIGAVLSRKSGVIGAMWIRSWISYAIMGLKIEKEGGWNAGEDRTLFP